MKKAMITSALLLMTGCRCVEADDSKAMTGNEELAQTSDRMQRKWQPHTVRQYRGDTLIDIPASAQLTTASSWGHSLVYMPDKNRLLLYANVPAKMAFYSDDLGNTWAKTSVPCRFMTYLGGGKVLGRASEARFISNDYGVTWQPFAPVPPEPGLGRIPFGSMGPDLVDKDPTTGGVVRLAESINNYIRFSTDGGFTWPVSIKVQQPWSDETVLVRAGNGDIVAATRTCNRAGYLAATGTKLEDAAQGYVDCNDPTHVRYYAAPGTKIPDPGAVPYDRWRVGTGYDFYSGLAVNTSKDNGYTWSPLNQIYMYGRFHASIVRMPNNDLVMSYVVRLGYDDTPEGLPEYGIEAVVSHDHGQTWSLDHRYVLDKWFGEWADRPGGLIRLMAPNETYTVLLRDGSLVTSFERGVQEAGVGCSRRLKLVRWRLSER